MFAKRYHTAIVGEGDQKQPIEIAYFSPSEKEGEPFWGSSDKPYSLFKNSESADEDEDEDFKQELIDIKARIKGGKDYRIEKESILYRDGNRKRKPDQNTVMGESAKNAYEGFLETMIDRLSDDMKEVMRRAIEAPLRNIFKSNYRPEWLHALGWSLTHKDDNPQNKENLGSAPKWANTEMMVLERIAKFFALYAPEEYHITIKPHFEMLLESELIKTINFEVTIEDKDRFIQFLQELNPFQKYPLFRKASDLAQGTVIANAFLQGTVPMMNEKVKENSNHSKNTSFSWFAKKSGSASESEPKIQVNKKESSEAKHLKTKTELPTHYVFEKSVVRIEMDAHSYNYDEPWSAPTTRSCSGSGVVIEQEGKKYILTNAHVAENYAYATARMANNKKKYEVKPFCVSYQSDLALLEVLDDSFQDVAEAVQLGDMVSLKEKVQTVGFPMGGAELSISKGIVSRIEVGEYAMTGGDMIQVGIDAAVNHGNSGGPVFAGTKVVGIAFQGYDLQGLGFMIPIPIVTHFLKEAFSGNSYRGFPTLPIKISYLENATLKEYYGLQEDETGVLLNSFSGLSNVSEKLQFKDILLEIDGMPISDDGKVDMPGIGARIDMDCVTHLKFIGDEVSLKIMRLNNETRKKEVLTVNVVLDHIPLEHKVVSQTEFDKMPSYYIASGFSFVPVTYNYMDGRGVDLDMATYGANNVFLSEVYKTKPDQQFIVINEVFSCKETEEYSGKVNNIISEINGMEINNLHDVVKAFESNAKAVHVMVTNSGADIVVKNMSSEQHAKLLKKYHIPKDRSDDLDIVRSPKQIELRHLPVSPIKRNKPESLLLNSDTEDDEVYILDTEEPSELTQNQLPGFKKYLQKLDDMEEYYKNDLNTEEFDFDEESSDTSLEESDLEFEDTAKIDQSSRFFRKTPSGRYKKDVDFEEEEEKSSKRKKY